MGLAYLLTVTCWNVCKYASPMPVLCDLNQLSLPMLDVILKHIIDLMVQCWGSPDGSLLGATGLFSRKSLSLRGITLPKGNRQVIGSLSFFALPVVFKNKHTPKPFGRGFSGAVRMRKPPNACFLWKNTLLADLLVFQSPGLSELPGRELRSV